MKDAYEDRTVEQLRDELRSRELQVSGSKAELVDRLAADDKAAEKGKPATTAAPADSDKADTTRARKAKPGECVVDDGTPHMGRATPGAVICSAHAMHYKADGTRRT